MIRLWIVVVALCSCQEPSYIVSEETLRPIRTTKARLLALRENLSREEKNTGKCPVPISGQYWTPRDASEVDGWGHRFFIICPLNGHKLDVISAGADGKYKTFDDIGRVEVP